MDTVFYATLLMGVKDMKFEVREFQTKLDPSQVYQIFSHVDTVLLDSSMLGSEYSNYSFIGVNCFLKFSSREKSCWVDGEVVGGDPLMFWKIYWIGMEYDSNIPFLSGAVGYFSYDMARILEVFPDFSDSDFNQYDYYFIFFANLIIFDLRLNRVYVTALGKFGSPNQSIDNIIGKIADSEGCFNFVKELSFNDDFTKFRSNFTEEGYRDAIRRIKGYILKGHTYIADMTQRFMCLSVEDSYDIYLKLRGINPAPFSVFMRCEDIEIISSSPERFIRIIDGRVETRPIKGTRPRGKTPWEDGQYRMELLASEKDRSELLMVVDLMRNDLNRCCKAGSIGVPELFRLESYSTVFHLVATVVGELRDDVSSVGCIKNIFPGGSITGPPKIRTMEIIEEVEELKRGLYTGAIGYFDFRGNSDFNIAIRTIVKRGNKAYFGVGGGITIESDEAGEFKETLDKALALMGVL